MKKILLATTFLVATAGFAAAEISFGGSASMGVARQGDMAAVAASGTPAENAAAVAAVTAAQAAFDAESSSANQDALDEAIAARDAFAASAAVAAGPFETYSSVNLAVTFSGDTDNGLTFGADFDMTAGRTYTLGDADGFGDGSGAFGMPTIWVDGAYGKLSVSDDNFDFFDDTNAGGDVMYEGTFGVFTVGLIADVDASEFSTSLAYASGNLAASANFDTYSLWNVEASYTFKVITATIATDEASNSSVKVAYASGPVTASLQYNTDADAATNDSFDVAVGFANNGMSFDAEYNTDSQNYTVTAGYDLGGGLALEAGTNYTGDVMIGAAMTF